MCCRQNCISFMLLYQVILSLRNGGLALLLHLTFVFNAWILFCHQIYVCMFFISVHFVFWLISFSLWIVQQFLSYFCCCCCCWTFSQIWFQFSPGCSCSRSRLSYNFFFISFTLRFAQFWINKFEYLHRVFSQTFRFGNFPFFQFFSLFISDIW